MKILQINTVCGTGSTGSIATDIADVAEAQGHLCYIAYGQGHSLRPRSYKIGGTLENHIHNLCSRLFGNQGYYSQRGTNALIRYIEEIRPNIIHLHNLHGNYLNLPILFNYLSRSSIPVVLTLHDCWAFTGKCAHYTAAQCFKWQTVCCNCPQYKNYPPTLFFDRAEHMYMDKKRWFGSIKNLHVITVSKWLQQEAQKSFLGQHPVLQIYNWIDHTKFHRISPKDYDFIFDKYQLPRQYKYLLSVGAGWGENISRFVDAKKMATKLPADYRLLLVGAINHGTQIPAQIYHIPYTSNSQELAAIYSLAEAYVHFSVEDTFGKVIAEAMACGTPPIVFNSTACPEIAGHTEFVVEPHDIDRIISLLPFLDISLSKRDALVSYVKTHYDYTTNIQKYIDLYNQLFR